MPGLLYCLHQKAVKDAALLFLTRETDKNLRHLEGEIAQGRVFMAFVLFTLGGIGPPATVEWIDSLFQDSRAQEFAATGSATRTSSRRTLLLQSLHACIVRAGMRPHGHLPRRYPLLQRRT